MGICERSVKTRRARTAIRNHRHRRELSLVAQHIATAQLYHLAKLNVLAPLLVKDEAVPLRLVPVDYCIVAISELFQQQLASACVITDIFDYNCTNSFCRDIPPAC